MTADLKYNHNFDTADGLKYLDELARSPLNATILDFEYEAMMSMADRIPKGGIGLEIGCGPHIGNILMFASHFDAFYAADYSAKMREPIENWMLDRQTDGYNVHSATVNEVASVRNVDPVKLEAATRKKLKGVFSCDIHGDVVLGQNQILGPFDFIISRYCLLCSPNLASYKAAMRSVARLLRPGGVLLEMSYYNESTTTTGHFYLNEQRIPDIRLSKADLLEAFEQAGLDVVRFCEKRLSSEEEVECKSSHTYVALCEKV